MTRSFFDSMLRLGNQARRTLTLLGCIILATLAHASLADKSAVAQNARSAAANADIEAVRPFLSETTLLAIKVDPTQLGVPASGGALEATPEIKAVVDRLLQNAAQAHAAGNALLQSAASGQTLYATIGIPSARQRNPIVAFRKKTTDEDAKRVIEFVKQQLRSEAFVQGEYIVAKPTDAGERDDSTAPQAVQDAMGAAFAAVAEYPICVVFAPPEHVSRTIRELSPELPPSLGGGPSNILTDGVQWAALGLNSKGLKLEVVIQSANPKAAKQLAANLPRMLQSAHASTKGIHRQVTPELAKLLINWLEPTVEGDQVRIRIEGHEKTKTNVALLSYLASMFEKETRRNNNVMRFKQILLGMHNYHDVYRTFPPSDKSRDKDGKQLLSWRVHILPFVEQAALYQEFHLDEPWDSPHNKKLIAKMPDVFASDSHRLVDNPIKPGHTVFLAPVGEKTVFGGDKATQFRNIVDGTSNTVAIVEVTPKNARPWTAPQDYEFDAKDPLKGVYKSPEGLWLSALCDGSVRRFNQTVPAKTVLHLFQMNDGNTIKFD